MWKSQTLGVGGSLAPAPGGRGAWLWGRFFSAEEAEHHPGSHAVQEPSLGRLSRLWQTLPRYFRPLLPPPPTNDCQETPENHFSGLSRDLTKPRPVQCQGCALVFRLRGWLSQARETGSLRATQDVPLDFSHQELGLGGVRRL